MASAFELIVAIGRFIFRRGHGFFKFLFVVDDFIRVFTMAILFIVFFTWLKLPTIIVFMGGALGLVIDIHDFVSDNEFAKFFD